MWRPEESTLRKLPGVIRVEVKRLRAIDRDLAVCRVSFDLDVRLRGKTTAGSVAKRQMEAIKAAYGASIRLSYDRDTKVRTVRGKRRARGDVKALLILPVRERSPRTMKGVDDLVVDRVKIIRASRER